MDLEQIVQQILSVRRELSREDILRKIYDKKRSAEDYFIDEVAARLVASELGVEIANSEDTLRAEITIKDLITGLNNVTVVGRVMAIYPVQTFSRSDLTIGKVARLLLTDKTGTAKLVLWDEHVQLVETEKIRPSQIIKVSHGYVREGFDGKVELHLGKRGEIEASPSDIVESEFPMTNESIVKIGSLTSAQKKANVLGFVHDALPASEFKRQDGTEGKVKRLSLKDDSGETTLVFWNEKVDELGDVERGDYLRVINARTKQIFNGKLELHIENTTKVEKLPKQEKTSPTIPSGLIKIASLKPNMNDAEVLARVYQVGDVRQFRRPTGQTGQVASLHLLDETGSIQLNLWNEQAEAIGNMKIGDTVLIEHAYTRQRFDKTELNLGSRGSITANPPLAEAEKLPQAKKEPPEGQRRKISDIQNEGGPFTVEASVASQPETREVTTRNNEQVLLTSFDISDETGKIHVTLWRNQAEDAKNLTLGIKLRLSNVYAKRGFTNMIELTSRNMTTIEILKPAEATTQNKLE